MRRADGAFSLVHASRHRGGCAHAISGERPRARLSLREAAALGLLEGPTELLPVSSSAHTTLIPWLAGWRYSELDPALRKQLQIALHAGAGAALATEMRSELLLAARSLDRRGGAALALALAPPALAGWALERPIERRLGGPKAAALGLLAGALAMALADARPGALTRAFWQRGSFTPACRPATRLRPGDGLALGVAQALALIPGVSRYGATLAAARARGFAREDASLLSWYAALPVILGAAALKVWRLRRRPADGAARLHAAPALSAGAACAFISTLASARVLRRPRVSRRPLAPYAVYRALLAAIAIRRLRACSRAAAKVKVG